MARLAPAEGFEALKESVSRAIKDVFPFEGKRHTLRLDNININDNKDIDDIRSQKKARLEGRTWSVPVDAEMSLVDNATGKVIDTRKQRLMNLPKVTKRHSYIVDGQEHQIDNQWRLKPGVYSRRNDRGDLESSFHLKGRSAFKVFFDPESSKFAVKKGDTHIPLYPLMKEMGVTDNQLRERWGPEILEANREEGTEKALKRFYKATTREQPKNDAEARSFLQEFMDGAKMDPKVSEVTLGKAYSNVNGEAVAVATQKLLGISRGTVKPDARDSLMFKSFHSVEDFAEEAIKKKSGEILRRIGNNLDRQKKIKDVVSPDIFNRPLRQLFVGPGHSTRPSQTNPLEMISGAMKTTLMGEGGIKSEHTITEDAKLIDPSHLGFLDPIHTPEDKRTGVTLHLPLGVKKKGDTVSTRMFNLKTKKMEDVDPRKAYFSNVVLPDQVHWDKGTPVPINKTVKFSGADNEIEEGSLKQADYVMAAPAQMFSVASNMAPFLQNDSGNRASMAGRQMEQAIPLKYREAPIVEPVISAGRKETSLNEFMGKVNSHTSPISGVVTKIKKDGIFVKGTDGEEKEVQIYNDFPLNDDKGFINSEPIVKVGDKVKRDQTVADTSYTRGGKLALGTNLRAAYVPFHGYNFEDGVVVSETAAKKLTSEHMYRKGLDMTKEHTLNKNKFLANFDSAISKDQAEKLDDDGVVKKGQSVKPGDTLVAALRLREETDETKVRKRMHKSLAQPYDNVSVAWEGSHPGVVANVVKRGRRTEVHVKTEEPAEVGDKVTGRHGNKGILTKIVPDHEMPKMKDGKAIEIALNPAGVPGRLNLGQVLETAAAKVAEKTGKPYQTQNFDGSADKRADVARDLKKHGIEDKEEVFDPKTGKSMGKVLVGPHYIHKLEHQVGKKLSARAGGHGVEYAYDRNRMPKGGGPHGAQALDSLGIYAMLAHGSTANLREMQTYKSNADNNDQFWSAIQSGDPLPPPRPTFAYNKFGAMLTTMGVNMVKEGNNINLMPLTDKQVLEMSSGAIKDAGKWVYGKNLKEEKGGLFDKDKTGGRDGTKWSHIKLPEPMPNPIFEKSIRSLTGLKERELNDLMTGKTAIDLKTGAFTSPEKGVSAGPAVAHLLKKVDVDKDLAAAHKELQNPNLKGGRLDKVNKKIKYLQSLKKLGMSPTEAYMTKNVAVLPPSMRPISAMPDGRLINDDLNHMYKGLGLAANKFRDTSKYDLPEEYNLRRAAIYDGMKALSGVGGHLNRKFRGVLDIISGKRLKNQEKGGKPAESYFQSKLIKRKQDMTMRSTIIPEPELGLDQVGIPRKAAMELYKPFLVRELRGLAGVSPLEAQKMVKERDPMAQKALERVIQERPLLLKRDPVLHKYGVQAFKPILTSGKAVKIHPLVTSGYNADFDGDCAIGEVIVVTLSRERYRDSDKESLMPHTERVVSHRILDLKDFPRLEETKVVKRSGVIEFDVPEDTYVPALNGRRMSTMQVTKFSIHPDCEEWVTTTRNGREFRTSSDHSLALLDPETLEVVKTPPRLAEGLCLPVLRGMVDNPIWGALEGEASSSERAVPMLEDVPLSEDVGWFLGATIGDGWVSFKGSSKFVGARKEFSESQSRAVCLAYGKGGEQVARHWEKLACEFAQKERGETRKMPHTFAGSPCESSRVTVSSTALGLWLEPLIGKYARGKHLPPRFMELPQEFRRGLFCGLIDTDGTVNWNKRGQFSLSYSTVGERLSEEIILLGLSLGLPSSRTITKTPRGEPSYIVHFSINPIQEAGWIKLFSDHKRAALQELQQGKSVSSGRNDFVPLTNRARDELLAHLRDLGASRRPPNKNAEAFSQYVVLQRSQPTITRQSVERLAFLLEACPLSDYLDRWFVLALDQKIGWDLVEDSKPTGEVKEMYDITVPEAWTFTMANGGVVWDTMGAFVPVGHEAVEEAKKMFPSRNLFSPATGGLMYRPAHESQLGIYTLTQPGKNTNKRFATVGDAAKAAQKGEIGMTDVVSVGRTKTTVGRALVASALPKPLQSDVLKGREPLDGKGQAAILSRVAKNFKNDYGDVANKIKDLGNKYATSAAISIGLDDIKADKTERDRILADADRKVAQIMSGKGTREQKEKLKIQVYDRASEKMINAVESKHGKRGSAVYTMMKAGVKPKMGSYRQITMAPMLIMNAKGETIPNPIRKSWSEGLDVGDYWTQMSGARKGIIQKVQSVQEPGYFTKQMVNSVMNNAISTDDCATSKGISLPVDERDILDRYLATDIKSGSKSFKSGTLVTPGVRDSLRNNKVRRVVVRSPMRCEHGSGVCGKCYGLDEDGTNPAVGKNVGIISAQSIGERATQLAMRTFHEGGISPVGKKGRQAAALTDEFNRVQQLTLMPRHVPGSAPLSTLSGKVTKVRKDPAGGHNVFVNNVRHYIPQDRGEPVTRVGDRLQKIQKGMQIGKGSILSKGPVNVNEMLPLTGVNKVQGYLAGQLYDLYKGEGIRRRNIETVVKSMTNLTKVRDPGDHGEFIRGDFAPTSKVQALNKRLAAKNKKPIVHTPVLKGVKTLPLDMQTDWMARLNHERLNSTVIEAANQGWGSNIHGDHPIPALAYGAEIGRKKPY